MARSCPACSRPNADTASKCLYCSQALTPVAPDPGGSVEEHRHSGPEGHLLLLAPLPKPDEKTIALFAEWTALSRYEARIRLQSPRPSLFRRFDRESEASRLSKLLTSARIRHLVVPDRHVRDMPVVRLKRASFGDRALEADSDGGPTSIGYADLSLLVRGEIVRESHDERNVGTKNAASRGLSPGLLLHLYTHESVVAFEIDPDHFRWPDGAESPSALLNLEWFLAEVAERSGGTRSDRGFAHETPVLSRSGAGADLTQMLSGNPGGSRGALYDNSDQFRFYARWRYHLERHLRTASDGE